MSPKIAYWHCFRRCAILSHRLYQEWAALCLNYQLSLRKSASCVHVFAGISLTASWRITSRIIGIEPSSSYGIAFQQLHAGGCARLRTYRVAPRNALNAACFRLTGFTCIAVASSPSVSMSPRIPFLGTFRLRLFARVRCYPPPFWSVKACFRNASCNFSGCMLYYFRRPVISEMLLTASSAGRFLISS